MKELEIFGRNHKYDFEFEIKQDIEVMNKLSNKITEAHYIDGCSMNFINIFIPEDYNFICNDCIRFIYDTNKERLNEESIYYCLLKCSIEYNNGEHDISNIDCEKITFLPDIQKSVIDKLQGYINELNKLLEKMAEEKQKEQDETERRKTQWSITNVIKEIIPSRGENGKDGYFDAEYTSIDSQTIRMVSRDVFDFGCYSYPKRFEGTDDVFNRDNWTEIEIQLANWLSDFGRFHGTRM